MFKEKQIEVLIWKFRGLDAEIKEEREKKNDHRRQIRDLLTTRIAQAWRGHQDDLNATLKAGVWPPVDAERVA